MSFGQSCKCSECNFDFLSGHSHHTGVANAVCIQCDARYCLPTKSNWGPDYDELLELHTLKEEPYKHRGRNKNIQRFHQVREPVGQYVMAAKTEPPGRGVMFVGVEELACTACKTVGRIVLDFQSGDACPRCKVGKLRCSEVIY